MEPPERQDASLAAVSEPRGSVVWGKIFNKRTWLYLVCAAAVVFGYVAYFKLWGGGWATDWAEVFYPAAQLLASGKNPYPAVPKLHNPIWTLIPLIPFTWFQPAVSAWAYFAFSLLAYGFTGYRLGARPIALSAFLLSAPVLHSLQLGNVDILVVLGFALPAPIGLFFVLVKPQIGVGMAIYWLVEAWKRGGVRKVVQTFAPAALALAASIALFGNSLVRSSDDVVSSGWNASLWPYSIPLGIALLYLALKYAKRGMAISASPFLSPYVAFNSWQVALAGLLGNDLGMVLAVAAIWIFSFLVIR